MVLPSSPCLPASTSALTRRSLVGLSLLGERERESHAKKLLLYTQAVTQLEVTPALADEAVRFNGSTTAVRTVLQGTWMDFCVACCQYCLETSTSLPLHTFCALETAAAGHHHSDAERLLVHWALGCSAQFSKSGGPIQRAQSDAITKHHQQVLKLADSAATQAEKNLSDLLPSLVAEVEQQYKQCTSGKTLIIGNPHHREEQMPGKGSRKGQGKAGGQRRVMDFNWNCDICNAAHPAGTAGTWWAHHPVWGEYAICMKCTAAGKTPDTEAKEQGCAQQ